MILGPLMKQTNWAYPDLAQTPPDFMAQYSVVLDELNREEQRRWRAQARRQRRQRGRD